MERQRDKLADVLKGIGILSVVMGHSGTLLPGLENIPTTQFVYLYHLMVFFFVSGMVFNPKKYNDIYVYVGRQIKTSYPLYVVYNLIFLLLHNLMGDIQMLELEKFDLNTFAVHASHVFTLHYTETILGAMWFVPMFLISKILFAIGFDVAEKCRFRYVGHAAVIILSAAIGLYTNKWGMFLYNHVQTSFLGIPVIYLGYFFKIYKDRIIRYVIPMGGIIAIIPMIYILQSDIGWIDLASNQIINPLLFYPITIFGMLFCVSMAQIICYSKHASRVFSYLGAISFHIMALHFVAFKLFDWSYGILTGADRQSMMAFPNALPNMGLLYCATGIVLPVCVAYLIQNRKKLLGLKKKMNRSNIGPD